MEERSITKYYQMLDEKKIKESEKRVNILIQNGDIVIKEKDLFATFFLNNSKQSFDVAQLLYDVSTKSELKKITGFPDFNGFLWTINSSYYSMFYMVRSLLEKYGIKIKTEQSIHLLTFDLLLIYFYSTGKIEKQILEDYGEANNEISEILGKEKAKSLVEDYSSEREKRGRFTYEMGEIALQNKAKTSLDRARRFNEVLRKMIQ
ncbi:MAG: hypothetical protein AABX23_03565 [Nanoarchaeota archaeon]